MAAGLGVRGVAAVEGETRGFLARALLSLHTARNLRFCSALVEETEVPDEIVSGTEENDDLRDPARDDTRELAADEGAGVWSLRTCSPRVSSQTHPSQ